VDFLVSFGNGGTILSMMEGLGTVCEAALFLGNYDVYAFEADPVIWKEAQRNISHFITKMEKKEKNVTKKLREFGILHNKLNKIRSGEEKSLSEDDVTFLLINFLLFLIS